VCRKLEVSEMVENFKRTDRKGTGGCRKKKQVKTGRRVIFRHSYINLLLLVTLLFLLKIKKKEEKRDEDKSK